MFGKCEAGACGCDGKAVGSGGALTVYSKHFELACMGNVTYFSACHAGCQLTASTVGLESGQSVFHGCGCSAAAPAAAAKTAAGAAAHGGESLELAEF